MSVNRVVLTGNLTRTPDMRATASGTEVMVFGIAVNERVRKGDDWEDYANFFDCVMFGKRAASLSKILSKGMKVCVSGRLRYSSWEKDGQRRSKVEVIADEIDIMQRRQGEGDGSKGASGSRSNNYASGGGNGPQNGSQGFSSDDYYDDDMLF